LISAPRADDKGVLFASGAITYYEGNNMLSALAKYVINRLIHDLFILPLSSALGADIKVSYKTITSSTFSQRIFSLSLLVYYVGYHLGIENCYQSE
jgi:hypothetical protein